MVVIKWEKIEGNNIFDESFNAKFDYQTYGARARTGGGWLVHYSNDAGSHMFFVPDPDNEWQ